MSRKGRNLAAILAGTLGVVAGASIMGLGCGSGGNGGGPNSPGPDSGGGDSGTDAPALHVDASDATTSADAADSASNDGGAMDASDASAVDAPFDGPPLADFPHAVDQAYCLRLQQCCDVPDADWKTGASSCNTVLDNAGGVLRIGTYSAAFDSGAIVYDTNAATICLNELAMFACGTVPASAIVQLKTDCFAAIEGTLGVDAGPCINPLQCNSGEFCQLATDGGPGICVGLRTDGQPCADQTYSTDCSYLGNGAPALYCGPGDGGTVCQPQLPLDAGCTQNPQCQSGACNSPICVNSYTFSDPGAGICETFTAPPPADAGDGG